MKVIRIDPGLYPGQPARIIDEIDVEPILLKDAMYVRAKGIGMIHIAYVYPLDKRDGVQAALDRVNNARKQASQIEAEVFFKILPEFRKGMLK